jgi:uncharacterized membrane protein
MQNRQLARPEPGMVMASLGWLLADEDSGGRIQLIFLAFGVVTVILIGAGVIEMVKRWRKRPFQARVSASEQLAQFREQYEKGQIIPEDFERIRAVLNERIRQEMEVSAAPAAPPPPEKPANPNGPPQ